MGEMADLALTSMCESHHENQNERLRACLPRISLRQGVTDMPFKNSSHIKVSFTVTSSYYNCGRDGQLSFRHLYSPPWYRAVAESSCPVEDYISQPPYLEMGPRDWLRPVECKWKCNLPSSRLWCLRSWCTISMLSFFLPPLDTISWAILEATC